MADDLAVVGEAAAPPADVQAATARRGELMGDSGFRDRYLSGNAEARNEIAGLNAQIVAAQSAEITVDLAYTMERAREMGCSPEVVEQIKDRRPVSIEEMEGAANWKRGHMADKAWVSKLTNGDLQARREMFLANLILSSPLKQQPAA